MSEVLSGDRLTLSSGPAKATERKHYPGLDGLRGIALLGVLLVHASEGLVVVVPPNVSRVLVTIFDFGVYGVDLFFVLSGFLITGILLRSKTSSSYFTTFYARRFLRLMPLYFAYLLVIGIGVRLLHRATHSTMADYQGNWWWYLLYLSNWKSDHGAPDPFLGHFWSLAVEEQFYLVWPLIVFLCSRRGLAWVCSGLILLATVLRIELVITGADWNTVYRSTFTRVDTLAFGALVTLALSDDVWRFRWARWYKHAGAVGALALACLIVYAGGPAWTARPIQIAAPFAASLGFAALITYAVLDGGQWLQTGWLRSWGRYSYAGYVLHPLVFGYMVSLEAWSLRRWNVQESRWLVGLAFYLFNIMLAFLVARWSWLYFEGPIQHWKDSRYRAG